MRARDADQQGYVRRGSVRVFWERYAAGKPDASTAMVHPALDAVMPRARRSTNTGGERGRTIQGRSTSYQDETWMLDSPEDV